jgi:formylmethanofuran dehydrogenase subunit C
MRPKRTFQVPIEVECVSPTNFVEKTLTEIISFPVWEGNKQRLLGELFSIDQKETPESNDIQIRIIGDLSKVKRIGTRMSTGRISINGNVGMHLGEEMVGGTITVHGNAGSWVGCMMHGGRIEINGNAGDYLGANYRGANLQGMNGGEIIVHGNAGNEVGCFMRNGLIKIAGTVNQFAGIHMRGGTIFIQQNSGTRAGAQMMGGKIVICGQIPSILPTFQIDSIKASVKVAKVKIQGPFYRFIGDISEVGDGKLFVSTTNNPHLKTYESKIA